MEFIMEFLFLCSSNVFFHVSVTAVLKEYLRNYMLLMLLFLKSPFRDQLFPLFQFNDLAGDIVRNTVIFADDINHSCKCARVDIKQQFLTVKTLWRQFVSFNPGKSQLIPFSRSSNTVPIQVIVDASLLEESSTAIVFQVKVRLECLQSLQEKLF